MNKTTDFVNLKELREHFPKYIAAVAKGSSFMVVKRSQPVFRIVPVDDWGDEGEWKTVVDLTKIKKGGIDVHELLERIDAVKQR